MLGLPLRHQQDEQQAHSLTRVGEVRLSEVNVFGHRWASVSMQGSIHVQQGEKQQILHLLLPGRFTAAWLYFCQICSTTCRWRIHFLTRGFPRQKRLAPCSRHLQGQEPGAAPHHYLLRKPVRLQRANAILMVDVPRHSGVAFLY